jgi:gamma-glutamylcyclotransferase (GGCT)/AIG2-like uncharacterized protein YtfP
MGKKMFRVAVYGSLRKGLGNHSLLRNHKALNLGQFQSKPEFTMYSLGGFPCIVQRGTTSILFEVYSVDEEALQRLDQLEGYRKNSDTNFYDRVEIDTPWGKAYTYVFDPEFENDIEVTSGNWLEYVNLKELQNA